MKLIEKSDPKSGKFYDIYMPKSRSKKTIYFLGSYGGRLIFFWIFFTRMTLRGYRVVYLQPCTDVLSSQHPQWLGKSIEQAISYINNDIRTFPNNSTAVVGVSLGGYLNMNILLHIKITKCVIVAGGLPIGGVARTSSLFRLTNKQSQKQSTNMRVPAGIWQPFELAINGSDLRHLEIMLINSLSDPLAKPQSLARFVQTLTDATSGVTNDHTGHLSHVLQSASINWRVKQIDRFLKK